MERVVKVDFFNFTTRRSLGEVAALFSKLPNPLVAQDKGLHGYNLSLSSPDGVTVLFSLGRSDVHVQLSGRGCDSLKLSELDILELLHPSDHVTRLDVAIDCVNSGFTCGEIWRLLQCGQFISVSSDIRQCQGLLSRGSDAERINRTASNPRPKTRSNTGHGIYIGATSSDRMVRMYDKGAESGTGTDWMRFEIQLRRKSANQFHLLMQSGKSLSELAFGLLNKQIRLVDEGQESHIENRNYDRVKLHPFWEKLTDLVAPLKLMLPKPLRTVRNALRYAKNVSSTLKMLQGVMPDFKEFFEDMMDRAELKPHHVAFQDDFAGLGESQSDHYHSYLLSYS